MRIISTLGFTKPLHVSKDVFFCSNIINEAKNRIKMAVLTVGTDLKKVILPNIIVKVILSTY